MKKFLSLSILSLSMLVGVLSTEAKTSSTSELLAVNVGEPQIRVQVGPNNRRRQVRRNRVVRQVRNVRRGRAIYRETYQVTYRPNGRTVTRLISRFRIR